MSTATQIPRPVKGLDHRTVWRWHFYAGLFCIPFVLWLSVTGTVFLFHPQIQRWLDRPYDHLGITQPTTANAQVQAALAAVPGSTLDSYELPHTPHSAAEILVDKGSAQSRVYVRHTPLQLRAPRQAGLDHQQRRHFGGAHCSNQRRHERHVHNA